MKNIRFIDRSLEIAGEELRKAIEWRDRSLSVRSSDDHPRRIMRSAMRRHALDSRRSFAGQLLCAGYDPRNDGPLPLAELSR